MAAHPSGEALTVPGQIGELNAVIGEERVDAVGHRLNETVKERSCCSAGGTFHQPGNRKLAGPVNRDEEIELAFSSLHLRDVDVEEAVGGNA